MKTVVFLLQQYAPKAPHCDDGSVLGVFSTLGKAQMHAGNPPKWRYCQLMEAEAPQWECGQWHITMLIVDYTEE